MPIRRVALLAVLPLSACVAEDLPPPSAYACEASQLPAHPLGDKFSRVVDDGLQLGVPAVGVAVETPEGLWLGAGGHADVAQDIGLAPCHRFYVGSATKVVTAAAILRLVDDGVLSLDDPAKRHLPSDLVDRIENLDRVTLRQLLRHETGIPEYVQADYLLEAFNFSLQPLSGRETLETYIYDAPADFAPGAEWAYSNSNYLLLGIVLETVTGRPAYDALRELVLAPLGLDGTTGRSENGDALVRGYTTLRSGAIADHSEATRRVMGAPGKLDGGLLMPPGDLAQLLAGLFDGELLSEAALAEMTTLRRPQSTEVALADGYGLGLMSLDTRWGPAYGHYGGVWPFTTAAFHFPDHDTTVVVELNALPEGLDDWIYTEAVFAPVLDAVAG